MILFNYGGYKYLIYDVQIFDTWWYNGRKVFPTNS